MGQAETNQIKDTAYTLFSWLGFYGPFLLIGFTLVILQTRQYYYYYYITGFVINMLVNNGLKLIIREPRPVVNKELFNIMKQSSRGADPMEYGMPSGHAQSVAFSSSFVFFLIQGVPHLSWWLVVFSVFSLITMAQRVIKKDHSVAQVIVGAIVGSIVGFLAFAWSRGRIMGPLEPKRDDGSLLNETMVH
jgi:membrane-associated phospholipid phosphatase